MTTDSPDSPDSPDAPEPSASESAPPASTATSLPVGTWAICLFLTAGLGWAALNFVPVRPETNKKYIEVTNMSPAALQTEADAYFLEVKATVRLRQMVLLGSCLGLAPLLFFAFSRRRGWLIAGIVALIAGPLLGIANAEVAERVRAALGPEVKIPFIDDGNRLVIVDAIVYSAISIVLLFPIALSFAVGKESERFQKSFAVVLGGLLAGGLLPLLGSYLFPTAQTNQFPPDGLGLTGLWLAMIAGLTVVVTTMTGSKK